MMFKVFSRWLCQWTHYHRSTNLPFSDRAWYVLCKHEKVLMMHMHTAHGKTSQISPTHVLYVGIEVKWWIGKITEFSCFSTRITLSGSVWEGRGSWRRCSSCQCEPPSWLPSHRTCQPPCSSDTCTVYTYVVLVYKAILTHVQYRYKI